MGRIAIALFGDQNNRTDEECVAKAAELGYGLTGARLRAERAENENERLRALLLETQKCLGDNDHEESIIRRIDAALAGKEQT